MSRFAWPQSSAEGRWSTFGPYYAMFPVLFARQAVEQFCPPGGAVLDPFCGRGTVPFVARVTGRGSLGIDLNAVAYVFSSAKNDPEPELEPVLARIAEIATLGRPQDGAPASEFQAWAWTPRVLGFLNAARRELAWRTSRLDRTVMALVLTHLHGKTGNAVSNQMRQSKSMGPIYAVQWWARRGLRPPDLDPVRYFCERAAWRYRYGVPGGAPARVLLGDAREALPRVRGRFSMLLTSPPYCGVTNYRVDNWIRLWMLGEAHLPEYKTAQRYANRERYAQMLREVFTQAKRLLVQNAPVLVRTDSRPFTRAVTEALLTELWPDRRQFVRAEKAARSQTSLFGDKGAKPGETDLLMLPSGVPAPCGFLPGELAGSRTAFEAAVAISAAL